VAWAASKCSFLLDGLHHFAVVTDSSPLVAVLNDRRLDQVKNDRLLKLKTALARYNFTARHQAGCRHLIAEALSRAPQHDPSPSDLVLAPEDNASRDYIVAAAVSALQAPTTINLQDPRLDTITAAGQTDPDYQTLLRCLTQGWPRSKYELDDERLQQFWRHRADLTVHQGTILLGPRLFIPVSLRLQVLRRLHAAHQGIAKTQERARFSVWWPTCNHEIEQVVVRCQPCREVLPSLPHQPLEHNPEAQRPFQRVHADMFQHADQYYLLLTDEYSGWPDMASLLHNMTADSLIRHLRYYFLSHTVPAVLHPDNDPPFNSGELARFLKLWGVHFDSSTPHLSRTNRRAEAAVKAMKRVVRGAVPAGGHIPDPDKLAEGIKAFRNQPRYGGRSRSELVYGRIIRKGLPVHFTAFDPRWQNDLKHLDDRANDQRTQGQARYDSRATHHKTLDPGAPVWIQNHVTNRWTIPGVILECLPHSDYNFRQLSGRVFCRNRVFLRPRAEETHVRPALAESSPPPPAAAPAQEDAPPAPEPPPDQVPAADPERSLIPVPTPRRT
jgi:hypothetical protein